MLPTPDDTGNIYTVLLYRALETVVLRYVQIPFSVTISGTPKLLSSVNRSYMPAG